MDNTLFTKEEKEMIVGLLSSQSVVVTHPGALQFVTLTQSVLAKLDALTEKEKSDGEQHSSS